MSIAYAFVEGQWLQCSADAYLSVEGRSEREWELLLEEWREQQRANGRKRVTIDASALASFLEEVLAEEPLLQQQRDLEGLSIRSAIVAHAKPEGHEPNQEWEVNDDDLDFTTLPILEEYR